MKTTDSDSPSNFMILFLSALYRSYNIRPDTPNRNFLIRGFFLFDLFPTP